MTIATTIMRKAAVIVVAGTLAACAATTKPGVVGVERQQLLLVSSKTVEDNALIYFAQQTNQAKSMGRLIERGPEIERLRAIGKRVIAQVPTFRDDFAKWEWYLVLIDSPQINANCAPGGKITFYTGIIRQLQLTDDEIAVVMGHEIAHALREHGRERVSQAYAQNLITKAALAGAKNPTAQAAVANQFAHYLFALPNSRQNESEADAVGLELTARAGYDPRAAVTLWQKMSKVGGGIPQFMSTHPSNESRLADINAKLPIVLPLYEQAKR